jgi:hypothetical protein
VTKKRRPTSAVRLADSDTMDLAGEWYIALDRENAGIRGKWYARTLSETIALPGSTDEARMGDFVDEQCTDRLSRVWRWIGPAWYQKTVTIPKRWHGKRITLFLERTKDSQVWVDRTWVGSDDSLSTPHEFDLSRKLTPGRHTITILIDNAKLPPVGPCHQVDERTQTNWNGILGRIELRATDKVWLDEIQAHPEHAARMLEDESEEEGEIVRVLTRIENTTRRAVAASVTIRMDVVGRDDAPRIPQKRFTVKLKATTTTLELNVPVPDDVPRWDEFDRTMIRLTASLTTRPLRAGGASKILRDRRTITFGMRTFRTARGQFVVNGRSTFLRGKNDCALFPITGYAPMDKDFWLRHLGIAQDYGINHYRFHSWCPPAAAFLAADELGIYFQVELPNKRGITKPDNHDYTPPKEAYETLDELVGDGGPPAIRTAYLTREGERILKHYGNHPSFVMMTLGNEIGGDTEVMRGMCDHFRSLDRRHLYAMGTNHFHWVIRYREGDDFWVIKGTRPGKHVRGASWETECHIDHRPPSTTVDYAAEMLGVPVPVVGHEMAQFEVYPDYAEIKKYTGVLKARSFEIFRERLKAAGMLDQAMDFHRASGALSVICHREDVEAALRTPGLGGFQMLDLQDFSGQGVALIGMLDVFMESKGLIAPKAWREFCCETVPLLWMTKYTWTNEEVFQGRIRVAHYGPRDLENQVVTWDVTADPCSPLSPKARPASRAARAGNMRGETRAIDIPTGTVTEVDLFSVDLRRIKTAQKLTVTLAVKGTHYRNSYDVWVYPAKAKPAAPKGIVVARTFTKKVQAALAEGARVLLLPKQDTIRKSVRMTFQGSFWSPMFRNRPGRLNPLGEETPGTQGILCDPAHPLFEDFPTEFHTNWQWWQLVKQSRAMILDDTPQSFRPLVQVVDGFDRNHKLGLIAEAKVGKGRLLICSIDLPGLQKHPEARQLLAGLYGYMTSKGFAPEGALDVSTVREIL